MFGSISMLFFTEIYDITLVGQGELFLIVTCAMKQGVVHCTPITTPLNNASLHHSHY